MKGRISKGGKKVQRSQDVWELGERFAKLSMI